MRALMVAALAMTAAGCATPHKPATACPKPTSDQEYDFILSSLDRAFGHRHGGYHEIVRSRSTDEHGDLVYQLVEIRPAIPEEAEGGDRLTLVVDACSLKVFKTLRPG